MASTHIIINKNNFTRENLETIAYDGTEPRSACAFIHNVCSHRVLVNMMYAQFGNFTMLYMYTVSIVCERNNHTSQIVYIYIPNKDTVRTFLMCRNYLST